MYLSDDWHYKHGVKMTLHSTDQAGQAIAMVEDTDYTVTRDGPYRTLAITNTKLDGRVITVSAGALPAEETE